VTQLHSSYMMIMKLLLLLMMMIMIAQKDYVVSTAPIYNLLTVDLVKIYCIEHCTLPCFGYQNTNFQKTFRSSASGRNRKLRSWAD